MKVYFLEKLDKKPAIKKIIADTISLSGFQLVLSSDKKPLEEHVPQSIYDQHKVFEEFAGFVIEITDPNPQITYMIAQAMIHKKPALCMYQKNREPRDFIALLKQRSVPDFIEVKAYNSVNITDVVNAFLAKLELGEHPDIASIKFTLRISPRIERFLLWKAHQNKTTKADFLRDMIAKMMKDDDIFQEEEKKKK